MATDQRPIFDNPASRLHHALTAIRLGRGETIDLPLERLWPGDDSRAGKLDRLAYVLRLPRQVWAAATAADVTYMLTEFGQIEDGLLLASARWRVDKLSLPDAAMVQLGTCGEHLHRHNPETDVDAAFLDGLVEKLLQLRQEVLSDDGLPGPTKKRLWDRLNELVEALQLRPLTGLLPAIDLARSTVGEGVATDQPLRSRSESRFWRTVAYIAALPVIVTPQLEMIQAGAETVTSVAQAVQEVRELWGPPVLENPAERLPTSNSSEDEIFDGEVVEPAD